MKIVKIYKDVDYIKISFDNDIEMMVNVFTSWSTEHLTIRLVLSKCIGYELVIDDPVAISNSNRVTKYKVDGNIYSQIKNDVTNPWDVLEKLNLTGYLKAVVNLYRKQNRNSYLPRRSDWIGDEQKVVNFVTFPK